MVSIKKYSELSLKEKRELEKEKTTLKESTINLTKVKINYKKMKEMLWLLEDSEKERDEALKTGTDKEKQRALRNYKSNIRHIVNYWNRNVVIDIQKR